MRISAVLEHCGITPLLFLKAVQDHIFSFQYKISPFQPNPLNQAEFHFSLVILAITGNTETSNLSHFGEFAWVSYTVCQTEVRTITSGAIHTHTTNLMISYLFNVCNRHISCMGLSRPLSSRSRESCVSNHH